MRRILSFCFALLMFCTLRAQFSVPLTEEDNGNKYITASVNGLPVNFTFDTGCSSLSLNSTIFNELLRRGLIRSEDVYGEGEAEIAGGFSHTVRYFIVKRLQVGDCELHNIRASVGVNDRPDATPLFGQAVLERFSYYTVSNNRLSFKPKTEEEQLALYKAGRFKDDTTKTAQQMIIEALKPYADHLSPRYQLIYADALRNCEQYPQSIAVLQRLMNSETYQPGTYSLMERIVNTEAKYIEQLYEDSLYKECEQIIYTVLKQAGNDPKMAIEAEYAYTVLCFSQIQQDDYTRAAASAEKYADYILAPNTCKDLLTRPFREHKRLAQLFYYLSRHFHYAEDYEAAQRYKTMCEHVGGYKE